MKKKLDIPLLVAALLLLALFLVPLWRITLEAPQYPDGISMYIWINKITGDSEFTLQNINILNHYVGMKNIEPDSIPELRYFPIIVIALVVYGVAAAFTSSRTFRRSWVIILVVLAALGVYDFYLWEYDYGHNLSPTAPIKVPGMVYQPPLFGTKMLLNFKAASYPHWGGVAMAISIIVGLISQWAYSRKDAKGYTTPVTALGLLLVLSSCANHEPRPLIYGEDTCYSCKMMLVDTRFGTEWISDKGKIFKFDAVECLLDYLQTDHQPTGSIWITPFEQPGSLISLEESHFLISKNLPSPMGMYLTAYKDYSVAKKHQKEFGGTLYRWDDLNNYFSQLRIDVE